MTLCHTFFLFFDIYLNIITDLIKIDDGATLGYNSRYTNNGFNFKRGLEILWEKNVVEAKTRRESTQRWGTL